MSYQGNPSLAQDVQERISNTFQQTLDLVTDEREQEALVGCEFILRMDPEFQPAKALVTRLKSAERPVQLEDLRVPTTAGVAPPAGEIDDLADLDALGSLDDLGDLDDLENLDLDDDLGALAGAPATARPPDSPAVAPPPASTGLGTVIADLLAKRNLDQILQIAETQKQTVENDPEVAALVEKARGLAESETYVQAFLKSAQEAQAAGRLEEMESNLAKARALDPEHPDIQGFAAGGAAEAPPAPVEADDDLMALQQQSLSLETGEMENPLEADDLADDLAHDPRQTKPMPAVSFDESPGDAAEPAPGDDFEVELFDAEATDAAVGDLDAELFNAEGEADSELEGPAAELFDADGAAALEAADVELTPDDRGTAAADEGGDRVEQLLAEGQAEFDRDEYQAAIDVWSRIFLIDIENQEASRRIEEARNKKAELERQAEELFHEAVGQIESGAVDEAKDTLARVLELAPSHSTAREYAEQLEAGQVPAIAGGDLDLAAAADVGVDLDADAGEAADSPSLEAAVARDRVVVVKRTDKRVIALGAVVLLAVVGSGVFLKLKWNDWFPNQETPPTMAQPRKVDPIERATKMHEGGNTENAILLLGRIQPQDPIYEDAQALIAQWKALVEAPPEPEETGPSEEQARRYGLLVRAAREAHKQGRHLRARGYFERAARILPLDAEDEILKLETDRQLESLEEQIKLFDHGQYAAIIPVLWRKRDEQPNNLDVQRLLVDSYYNLALTDLQRGNTKAAAQKVREALEVQPDNQELQRLQLFTTTYVQRRQDLLFRIFVKYLPSH